MEPNTITSQQSPPAPADARTAAIAERRRKGILWVETKGVEILKDFTTLRYGPGAAPQSIWVGIKNDSRNLLLEAYEALHPIR